MACEFCGELGKQCPWANIIADQSRYLDNTSNVPIKFTKEQADLMVKKWEENVLPNCSNAELLKSAIEGVKVKIKKKFR